MKKGFEQKKEFPMPVPMRKLIGPSFIILALGLGSGEIILWPYLASNYGLGIAWGAVLGISFQFFMNMEIERYALVKGESVFVGINRLCKWPAYWFIVSTFIGFGLPGIIAASAQILANISGLESFKWLAIGLLLLIGLVLSSGKTVYGLMERLTKTIILLGVPFVFILALILASKTDWYALFSGVFSGKGQDFWFIPAGISFATFLAAFAYSGAGGNLNLTQSIYIKEKGYGMGKYAEKIKGLFAQKGSAQKIRLTGQDFEINEKNLARCKKWWRSINLEHFFVFWFLGSISMLLLMLLSYTTVFGIADNATGINFVINEGYAIGKILFPLVGIIFLFVLAIMLFQTQLGVMDSTSRIMAENLAIRQIEKRPGQPVKLSRIYYMFLWAQIVFGIVLFLFNIQEPKTLIVIGAVINAIAMFVHVGLVFWLNNKVLPKELRPGLIRKLIMVSIFLFFLFFSVFVLLEKSGILA